MRVEFPAHPCAAVGKNREGCQRNAAPNAQIPEQVTDPDAGNLRFGEEEVRHQGKKDNRENGGQDAACDTGAIVFSAYFFHNSSSV